MALNYCVFVGRFVEKPKIIESDKYKKTAFTIAVDRDWSKKKTEKKCDFINCVAWNKSAEFICKYFDKGMKIVIQGRLQDNTFINKEGKRVYKHDVFVTNCDFIESKKSKDDSGNGGNSPIPDVGGFMNLDDEIDEEVPFE